jgi:hypothetical protein
MLMGRVVYFARVGYNSDAVRKDEEESDMGLGYKWWFFIKMMQAIWEHGSVQEKIR